MSRRRIAKRMLSIARVREQRARRDLERARRGVEMVESRLRDMAQLQEASEEVIGKPTSAAGFHLLAMGRIGYLAQRQATQRILVEAQRTRDMRLEAHRASLREHRTRERVLEKVTEQWRQEMLKQEQRELDEIASQAQVRAAALGEG